MRFTDILILIGELTVFLLLVALVLAATEFPVLVMVVFLASIVVHISIKRRKRILKYVYKDFKKLGYTLLEEKPVPVSELEFSIKPTVLVNKMLGSRYAYIRRFERIFKAKSTSGQLYELRAQVTKNWIGEHEILISRKTQLKEVV